LLDVSKAVSVSIFRQRTTNLVDPLDQAILSHCALHKH